jgi:hypothetical protein
MNLMQAQIAAVAVLPDGRIDALRNFTLYRESSKREATA